MLPLLLLLAQTSQSTPAFRSGTDLSVLHVAVVDRHEGFVSDLPREAFTVYEDGRPQTIAFFEHEDAPVTVGLAIDSSQSMMTRRDAVIAAGMAFAESSHPDDEIFTVNFNEHVWPGLPDGQAFTSDHAELHAALNRSTARGRTALFDAIYAGLAHLDRGTKTRKVLIVVSDGGDNESHTRHQDILDAALRADVVIYTVGIADPNDRGARPEVLRRLSEATGGESFFPSKLTDVAPALRRIARDIRSSYTIGYAPPSRDNAAVRAVRVDVRAPGSRRFTVRARSAYVRDDAEVRRGGS